MTSSDTGPRGYGIGLPGILGVLFITLKLIGQISWPWLWVLAPFWIPIALVGALFVFFGIVYGIVWLIHRAKTTPEERAAEKRAAEANAAIDAIFDSYRR